MSASLLAEIGRQAEQGYPKEVCGLVIGRPDDPATWQVRPIRNIADAEPQADVAGVERDARTAYLMDPVEELAVLKEMDAGGHALVAIYHSHPDHDPYFSAMDRDRALLRPGEPLWPGALYLVVSVRSGRIAGARAYRWDPGAAAFGEAAVIAPVG